MERKPQTTGRVGLISLITLVQDSLIITQTGKIYGYFYHKVNSLHLTPRGTNKAYFIVSVMYSVA